MTDQSLLCGIDRVYHEPGILDLSRRYGLVTNTPSVDMKGQSVKLSLLRVGLKITRLFSPEHGIHARGADGQHQADLVDEETGLPITSLYGPRLQPGPSDRPDFDALILDLPNVGARFYTYLWTMTLMMEWCHSLSLPMIILDRPNPLGGDLTKAEGPCTTPEFFSFLGRWNIPIRFGLSIGELAQLFKSEMNMKTLSLHIIPVFGWRRTQTNEFVSYPFHPPSPALLSPQTLWSYMALCFLEATNISENRGGEYSFRVAYAPWINGNRLEQAMLNYPIPGVQFQKFIGTPEYGKYAGQSCEGVLLNVVDYSAFQPVFSGMVLLAMIRQLYPQQFRWEPYPTFVNPGGDRHFELLTGSMALKQWMENQPLEQIGKLHELLDVPEWKDRARPYLLYD